MDRVVYLDRDGTINEDIKYLYRPEDLRFIPGSAEAIGRLNAAGYRVVVITNQAGVGRGYYTEEDVKRLHAYMNRRLLERGAHIDAFYYCPHHPEHGVGEYKKICGCRKPKTGLFERSEELFVPDKARSFMVGDKLIDVEAGRNYGVRGILVGTGYGREQKDLGTWDYYADDLSGAVDWILSGAPSPGGVTDSFGKASPGGVTDSFEGGIPGRNVEHI